MNDDLHDQGSSMKDRIRIIMDSQKMSQQDFALKLGISPASLSSIFNGRTNPTSNHTIAIHSAFPEISINWLMFGEGDMIVKNEDSGLEKKVESLEETARRTNGLQDLFAPANQNKREDPKEYRTYAKKQDEVQSQPGNCQVIDRVIKRQIKEIRVFYDDGTYESFVMSK